MQIRLKIKQKWSLAGEKIRFLLSEAWVNTGLFWLLGLVYLRAVWSSETLFATTFYSFDSFFGKALVMFFLFCTYVGHFALLAFLPCLILIPLALILSRRVIACLAVIAWSVSLVLLLSDIIIFSLFHFHLNITMLTMAFSFEYGVIDFLELTIREVVIITAIGTSVIVLQGLLAWYLQRRVKRQSHHKNFSHWYIGIIGCLLFSYGVFIFSITQVINVFAQQTPNFPLYNNIAALMMPYHYSEYVINRVSETRYGQPLFPVAPLEYPRHPLAFKSTKSYYNIVIIGIDAWRYDALNAELTPHISTFAQSAWRFERHFSGGNSTQAGLFSLFYSLPSNYWTSMLEQKRGAVLFDVMLKDQYNINILFSSNMIPPFHKTAFSALSNLRVTAAAGKTIPDRDRTITRDFRQLLLDRDKSKPFFTFLFYDAAHSYYDVQNIPKLYPTTDNSKQRLMAVSSKADAIDVMNRYKNAVHFIDGEVQQVIDALREQKLLEHTIVIITGDHGEEFNDNQLQFWGHGSNYTRYQLQVPLVVHWPHEQARVYTHQTNHYDVVPLLLQKAFKCRNPSSDFSIGENILRQHHKNYLLVGSYLNMGLVEKNKITTLLTSGGLQVEDDKAQYLLDQHVDAKILKSALADMRRFYLPSNY